MFSKVKPEKVYIFRFKNYEIHKESESKYFIGDRNYIFTVKILESYFQHPGYYELKSFDGEEVLRKNLYSRCYFWRRLHYGFSCRI